MGICSRLLQLSAVGLGIGSGIAIFMLTTTNQNFDGHKVLNSSPTKTSVLPFAAWNFNWDHRDPIDLVKPLQANHSSSEEKQFKVNLEKATPTASRHYLLIRHGQFNMRGATDLEKILTELGRKQAGYTGERLKTMQLPWSEVIISTMSRAQETGRIILESLPHLKAVHDPIIEEAHFAFPEPPVNWWWPANVFYQGEARLEAAFRKYIHRADGAQEKDSYTLIVCHANLTRYFVLRALQFPPEAWNRLTVNHASITWLTVRPDGTVQLQLLGDSGHIPPEYITNLY